MELEDKYLVLKIADIEAALTDHEKAILEDLIMFIDRFRHEQGKPTNSYIVVNRDEPYANDVIRLIERYQTQDEREADTKQRRSQGAKDGWEIRRAKEQREREA